MGSLGRLAFVAHCIILATSCGPSLPSFDNFDTLLWKNDRNGCEGNRKKMMESLISQKNKLLALKESQIVSLLGRPDQNELYNRNQKFYYYYFTAAPSCKKADSLQQRLELRFNALGLVKEVFITE
jgi:hypothetical protein